MRTFNYSEIKNQKWDSEILGLVSSIYKEVGKQELYLKQRPEELEKLVEIANDENANHIIQKFILLITIIMFILL